MLKMREIIVEGKMVSLLKTTQHMTKKGAYTAPDISIDFKKRGPP
ncbi:hypothetical protein CM15mP43_05100 [bacterium]|nr:MAG: hypothetical protein CM15mP43_05100 [bacterium]